MMVFSRANIWTETFATLDLDRWETAVNGNGWQSNPYLGNQQFYLPGNATIEQGMLCLRAEGVKPFNTVPHRGWDGEKIEYRWASGSVRSKRTFHFGALELGIRVPASPGLWAAAYLYGGYPSDEIDLVEQLGWDMTQAPRARPAYHSVHEKLKTPNAEGKLQDWRYTARSEIAAPHAKAYRVRLEWTPRNIDFFINDVRTGHYVDYVPQDPMPLILEAQVGGSTFLNGTSSAGKPDPGYYPAKVMITDVNYTPWADP